MWLPWEYALVLAGAALVVSLTARQDQVRAVGRETAILSVLYAGWQFAGRLSVLQIDGAVDRGIALYEWQLSVGIPSERAWQQAVLGQDWLIQASNIYYGGAHVPGMGVFLVWLFFAHRERYPLWRTALAITTALCLAIQLLPVAPPRLIPELGIVDTGVLHGQSVYSAFGSRIAGQLQAMPSIHVAWAALVAMACWRLGGRWARGIGVFHGVATMWVVVVTGNHYWSDGLVAVALLGITVGALALARSAVSDRSDAAADVQPASDHEDELSTLTRSS